MIAAPAEFSHHFILLVEHVASGNTRGSYVIPNINIRVSYFNQDVNLRECLTWLTEELEDEDFETIHEDNLFQKHRSLLLKMARGASTFTTRKRGVLTMNTMISLTCSINKSPLIPFRARRLRVTSRCFPSTPRITKAKHVVRV